MSRVVHQWKYLGLYEVQALAASFAPLLQRGDCLLLEGDLGAGKTEFARALIRALANDDALEVTSPTFTLMQSYPVTLRGEKAACWHVDLYRIEDPAELVELGLEDALEEGVLLVEWPGIAQTAFPPEALHITFAIEKDGKRRIELSGDASWQLRLASLSATTSV